MTRDEKVDGRSLRYRHRRGELLDGALQYVLSHGPADFSLRSMAQALGVSHATLLRHFASKEKLLSAVFEHLRGQMGAALEADESDQGAPTERARLQAIWTRLCEPDNARQFLVLAELHGLARRDPDRYGRLAQATVTDWLPLVEEGLRHDGWPDDRVTVVATTILAQIRGLQLDLAATGDRTRVDAAFDVFLDSLRFADP